MVETETVQKEAVSEQAYQAAVQHDRWFYDVSQHSGVEYWELASIKASGLYAGRRYFEAYKEFTKVLELKKHKTSHKAALLESKIRSGIKAKCVLKEDLEADLKLLEESISSHGDQIQLWALLHEFYVNMEEPSFIEHIHVVILLCMSNEYSKFWKMFANVRSVQGVPLNFYVFAGCKAVVLLRSESEMASGHLKARYAEWANTLEQELRAKYPKKIEEADRNLGGQRRFQNECHSDALPPHACRSTAHFKSSEEQRGIVEEFIAKFPWFFADWSSDLISQLKSQ
ncbi:hypothetical protein L596_011117 [Steinernema carpocapsae]|uniref:Uncharacterized protein n=1 Tax=Steinernema carpocapsae TaxID=34508 RepID=A0A4U5NTE2_STECR|nr:hypothetical protein L596_011117 [Steinernema carpocapsae]